MKRGAGYSGQVGSALLAVLLCAALVGMLALVSAHYLRRGLKLRGGEIHGVKARVLAEAQAVSRAYLAPHTGLGGRVDCVQGLASAGAHALSRSLCVIRDLGAAQTADLPVVVGSELADPTLFPALDYGAVFAEVSACAAATAGFQTESGMGFLLTATALQSMYLCRDSRTTGRESLVVRGNLEMGSELSMDSRGKEGALVAAALGYADLAAVRAAGKVVLVAGGDLHIGALVGAGTEPTAVTLVSATGVVDVDEVRGSAALKVIAWAGAYLPEGYSPAGNDLMLPKLLWEPVGLLGESMGSTDN